MYSSVHTSIFASRTARRFGLALLGTLSLACPAIAQQEDLAAVHRRMIAYERDYSEVMTTLEYLTDMIGPRLTGSERLRQANLWTAERMKVYGLDNVHLEPYQIPEGWERGTVEARLASPNGLPIHAEQMAWTGGTRGTVTGRIVVFNPKTESDFDAYRGKLRGAIVLTGESDARLPLPDAPAAVPIPALTVPSGPETAPKAPPARPNFQQMMQMQQKTSAFLASQGVQAVLRDSSKPHALQNMTGSWNNRTPYPTLFVLHEDCAMMHRLLKRKVTVNLELNVSSRFVPGPVTVYNTVGEIRGKEKPDEVVLLGAHLDSWDLGTGATDNGTGSSAVLEAARLIKTSGMAPKRTIRFVLFSGEEQGLHGSVAYVKAHQAEMKNFSVVFVHDTGTGRVKGLWLQDRMEAKPVLETEFAMLKEFGLLTSDPNFLPGKMNGTDHASFDDAGVPAFAFNQDSAEYGLTHHSQSDTFDKARPDDLKQGACVLAILALSASQRSEVYPRTPAKTAQQ